MRAQFAVFGEALQGLREEVYGVRDDLRTEMREMRDELRGEMGEMRTDIALLKTAVRDLSKRIP